MISVHVQRVRSSISHFPRIFVVHNPNSLTDSRHCWPGSTVTSRRQATLNHPGQNAGLQKRAVAGSFIFKYPEKGVKGGRPLVALFRRSDKVRTYPGKLGSISGSIEKDDSSPLAAAWRELHEETTLDASSLELIRHGKPYSFGDASVGQEWSIHPFAFRLKSADEGGRGEAGIKLDAEHEGWEWHDPLDVVDSDAFGGVPRIAESLRRVWFEKDLGVVAGDRLEISLQNLKTDHSGAEELVRDALYQFRWVVDGLDEQESRERWWANVRFAAWHMSKNGRKSMEGAVMNILLRAMEVIESELQQHQDWSTAQCKGTAEQVLLNISNAIWEPPVAPALDTYLREHLPKKRDSDEPIRILTLPSDKWSRTISKALLHVVSTAGFRLDLRVLESRPGFEGVFLASKLVENIEELPNRQKKKKDSVSSQPKLPRAQVTLYTDAAMAVAAEHVDIILLNADVISDSGAAITKMGSLPAVLSAKHISPSAQVVVLGDRWKIIPSGNSKDHVVEETRLNSSLRVGMSWDNSGYFHRTWGSDLILARSIGIRATDDEKLNDHGAFYDGHTGICIPASELKEVDRAVAKGVGVPVRVRDVHFERVGPELVDTYVINSGVWSLADIKKQHDFWMKEEQRLFGDL